LLSLTVNADRKTRQLSTAIIVFFPREERKTARLLVDYTAVNRMIMVASGFLAHTFPSLPFYSPVPKQTARSIVMTQLARPLSLSLHVIVSHIIDSQRRQNCTSPRQERSKCFRESSCNLIIYTNKNAYIKKFIAIHIHGENEVIHKFN